MDIDKRVSDIVIDKRLGVRYRYRRRVGDHGHAVDIEG